MVENIKEWKDLNAEELFKKILKKLVYWEIKKIIKWDLVFAQDQRMLLSQSLNHNGMLIAVKFQKEWFKPLKQNKLKLSQLKKNKLGIDGSEI